MSHPDKHPLQHLYESGIDGSISWTQGDGFAWRLGSWPAKATESVPTFSDAVVALYSEALKQYPDSKFAYKHKLNRLKRDIAQALETGNSPSTPDFLEWLAERLTSRYGEPPNIDFVQALQRKAVKLREIEREISDEC